MKPSVYQEEQPPKIAGGAEPSRALEKIYQAAKHIFLPPGIHVLGSFTLRAIKRLPPKSDGKQMSAFLKKF